MLTSAVFAKHLKIECSLNFFGFLLRNKWFTNIGVEIARTTPKKGKKKVKIYYINILRSHSGGFKFGFFTFGFLREILYYFFLYVRSPFFKRWHLLNIHSFEHGSAFFFKHFQKLLSDVSGISSLRQKGHLEQTEERATSYNHHQPSNRFV